MKKQINIQLEEDKTGNDLSDSDMLDIVNEVKKQIEIPEKLFGKKVLFCPVGLIASGKSTIVDKLAEKLGVVIVSTDKIRWLLQERGFNLLRTREIAFIIVVEFLESGYAVAIDADCSDPISKEKIENLCDKYSYDLIWFQVKTSEEEILKRLDSSNEDRKYKGKSAIENYYKRKKLHEKLEYEFLYVFDGTDELDMQIKEFIDKVKSK